MFEFRCLYWSNWRVNQSLGQKRHHNGLSHQTWFHATFSVPKTEDNPCQPLFCENRWDKKEKMKIPCIYWTNRVHMCGIYLFCEAHTYLTIPLTFNNHSKHLRIHWFISFMKFIAYNSFFIIICRSHELWYFNKGCIYIFQIFLNLLFACL